MEVMMKVSGQVNIHKCHIETNSLVFNELNLNYLYHKNVAKKNVFQMCDMDLHVHVIPSSLGSKEALPCISNAFKNFVTSRLHCEKSIWRGLKEEFECKEILIWSL